MKTSAKPRHKRAVILFTRIPAPGRVKTRMMPYLSPEGCAKLQTCCIRDIISEMGKADADIFVCYEPEGDEKVIRKLCGRQCRYFEQTGSGLGQRMENAMRLVLDMGYEAAVLTGSDIPEICAPDLEESFALLGGADAVIGPSADGGYYLIGMKSLIPELFSQKTYGHESVLDELRRTASQNGIRLAEAATQRDLDTKEDLEAYRKRMRKDRRLRKSHTGSFLRDQLRISVIVPVYNEEKTITKLTKQLDGIREDCEIIIVDGGSTDAGLSLIPPGYTVMQSEKGRARQMNTGARASHGDILFFLHSDSELPAKPLSEIRRVMAAHEAGCFGIAFHSRQFFMWTNRVISNHRAYRRRIMFGDQGMFMTRELFERASGFPDIPIMEDYQLSLTLRKMGVRPGITRHRIYTSDRRYPKENIPKLGVMYRMWLLRRKFRLGLDPEKIAAEYRDIR